MSASALAVLASLVQLSVMILWIYAMTNTMFGLLALVWLSNLESLSKILGTETTAVREWSSH